MPTGLAPAELRRQSHSLPQISTEQGRADKGKPPEKQQIFKNQLETIKMYLKKYGLRSVKPENVFYEIASGTDPTRPQWKNAINRAVNMKGKTFLVVKDPTRWSRDSFHGHRMAIGPREADVPIAFATDDMVMGTLQRRDSDAETLFGIKMVLSQGATTRQSARVRAGLEALKARGRYIAGTLPLWPFATRTKEYLLENEQASRNIRDGGIGRLKFGRMLRSALGPLGPGDQWHLKAIKKIDEIRDYYASKEDPEGFDRWLTFINRIRDLEEAEQFDGSGLKNKPKIGRPSFKVKALRFRFGGYMTQPQVEKDGVPLYEIPTEESIAETFDNIPDYLSTDDAVLYRRKVAKRG